MLRDRDLGGDLREVRAGGEIRDAAGHDGKELIRAVSEIARGREAEGACVLYLILELRDTVHARQFL